MSTTIEEFEWLFPYEKIKVPFWERPSRVKFPQNKVLAVNISVAEEWWGRDYLSGGDKVLDIGNLSRTQGYNFDVGIWRALELLDKHQLHVSFGVSGAAAKYYPDVIRQIAKRGHEIIGKGYYQGRKAARMSLAELKEDIKETTAILESVSGKRLYGWGSPGGASSQWTFELIAEAGYEYCNDLGDDDLPYGVKVKDKIVVALPHIIMPTNDYGWFSGRPGLDSPTIVRSPREAVEFFQDTFDGYYETANRERAMLLSFVIHPFLSCTPDRIGAIDRMISYMKGFPGVWLINCGGIARWWRENYL